MAWYVGKGEDGRMEQDKSQVSPKTLIMSEPTKERKSTGLKQDRIHVAKSLTESNGENWQNTKGIHRVSL